MKNLILDYIKQIKPDDIYNFGLKHNIKLNINEVDNLYYLLKKKKILDYNDQEVYDILKDALNDNNFKKGYNLYLEYKKRYKSYL